MPQYYLTEYKRMLQRHGTYEQFIANVSNLLAHEFASVISGDPSTTSGKALYFYFGTGSPDRVLTEEDKVSIDSNVSTAMSNASQALSTASNVQSDVSSLESDVQSQGSAIGELEDDMLNKLELSDMQAYAYSKSEVQTLLNTTLSNYYTSYIINDMLSFGFGEITTTSAMQKFAGRPRYSWVKLGFEVVNDEHVGGLCIMTIDSPLCIASNAYLDVVLPFYPANDMEFIAVSGTNQIPCHITANSLNLQIPNISSGDKVSAFFAYRVARQV